jgi:hypothetical protein
MGTLAERLIRRNDAKPSAKHLGFIASNLDKINVESDLRREFNLSC